MYKTIFLFIFKLLSAGFTASLLAFIGQVLIGYSYFSLCCFFIGVFCFSQAYKKTEVYRRFMRGFIVYFSLLALRIYVFMADKA